MVDVYFLLLDLHLDTVNSMEINEQQQLEIQKKSVLSIETGNYFRKKSFHVLWARVKLHKKGRDSIPANVLVFTITYTRTQFETGTTSEENPNNFLQLPCSWFLRMRCRLRSASSAPAPGPGWPSCLLSCEPQQRPCR